MPTPSPNADTMISRKFAGVSLELKGARKAALQEHLGWAPEPKRPMLCLPAGMSEKIGGKLFSELLPGLLTLPLELLVVGKGSSAFGALFTTLAKEHRHRIQIVADTESNLEAMYAGCDMALFLCDPRGTRELAACLHNAVVPVSLPCPVLENYDPVQESGNAFLCESPNVWSLFAALVRALETYKLPFDWKTIQKHGIESVR